MSLEDAYFISQIVAAVAIVASLLFVAIQLRQSDKTQRAVMHQARADRIIGFYSSISGMAPIISKATRAAETLVADEVLQLQGVIMKMILNLEDQLWQHKQGLLDGASVERTRAAARRIMSLPAMRAAWLIQRSLILPAQAEVFEREAIAGQPLAPNADTGSVWQVALADVRATGAPGG
ncbi:MAG: hypothetical protein KBA31_04990 [Alphaproteobacteria bacterium]|nr:hypothetical protein [Alphaproteobacteria bacterium]